MCWPVPPPFQLFCHLFFVLQISILRVLLEPLASTPIISILQMSTRLTICSSLFRFFIHVESFSSVKKLFRIQIISIKLRIAIQASEGLCGMVVIYHVICWYPGLKTASCLRGFIIMTTINKYNENRSIFVWWVKTVKAVLCDSFTV